MNQNETDTSPTQLWASLPIDSAQQANLAALGFAGMTPVQAATLPISLAGGDVIAQAKTGSGKTAAFAIPLLQKLNIASLKVQALVLCPTRELADQVCAEIRRLARAYENVKVLPLCGGVALRGQTASLENGAHIVVGTPGRVLDHLQRENLSFDALNTLVLDEADRMLDMGFADDIQAIAKQSPASRQTLLFSATYPDTIAALSARLMRQAQMVKVDTTHDTHAIDEWFFEVEPDTRLDAVTRLLSHYQPASTVAFCNTRVQCNDLVQILRAHGFSALTLHGDLDQRDRDQVLIQFANQSCSVLVATDVAARGLDIPAVRHVYNYDLPNVPENYVHRIGRTARAGADGAAIAFCSPEEMDELKAIQKAMKTSIPVASGRPWEALPTPGAKPKQRGGLGLDKLRYQFHCRQSFVAPYLTKLTPCQTLIELLRTQPQSHGIDGLHLTNAYSALSALDLVELER